MARLRTSFICQECGYQTPKWRGRCSDCGQWNSFVEEVEEPSPLATRPTSRWMVPSASGGDPVPLSSITASSDDRFKTHIAEFDRVMGGGIVSGSMVLVGGDPGIGKSTLLLQVLERLGEIGPKVLYVSGEESAHQIKLRAERLGIQSESIYILAEPALSVQF